MNSERKRGSLGRRKKDGGAAVCCSEAAGSDGNRISLPSSSFSTPSCGRFPSLHLAAHKFQEVS